MTQQFKKIAQEMGDLVTEKNAAYGDSFAVCGEFLRMLYPTGITADQYTDALCLVRIFDKMKRIATRKDAFGESPYRDIMGYALLGVAKDEAADPQLCPGCHGPHIVECDGKNGERDKDPRIDQMATTVTEAIMGCPSCMDRRACPKEGMRLDKDKRCLSYRPEVPSVPPLTPQPWTPVAGKPIDLCATCSKMRPNCGTVVGSVTLACSRYEPSL